MWKDCNGPEEPQEVVGEEVAVEGGEADAPSGRGRGRGRGGRSRGGRSRGRGGKGRGRAAEGDYCDMEDEGEPQELGGRAARGHFTDPEGMAGMEEDEEDEEGALEPQRVPHVTRTGRVTIKLHGVEPLVQPPARGRRGRRGGRRGRS